MALRPDLPAEIQNIFRAGWAERETNIVPEAEDVGLAGNDGVVLDAVVLYADLSESTALVDTYNAHFAAEVYKTYLVCAARVIAANDGVITAYDGDRIMAVYVGGSKNTNATRTALQINYCVDEMVNPALTNQYPGVSFRVRHAIGIDASRLLVARTGIRGSNDLVWVGRAANHAAKMSSMSEPFRAWISADVYNNIANAVKFGSNREAMWSARSWTPMQERRIYGSSWRYPF